MVNNRPVESSIAKYLLEIFLPQCRQRPRRSRYEKRGMLSIALIWCLQRGQMERPSKIDISAGQRQVSAPMKEPIIAPRMKITRMSMLHYT